MDSHRISWSVLTVTYIYIFIFPVAFRLYDLDRDDKISRDELLQVSGLVRHVNKTSLYSLWKLLVHAIIKSARWWIIFKTSFLVLKEIIVQYPCQNVTGRCRWEDFALVLIMRRFLTLTTGWFFPDSLISCIRLPSVLFVVPLWSHLGFGNIVWPVIAISSGLNDSDKSLV